MAGGRAGQRAVRAARPAEPAVTRLTTAWRYLTLGFTHIVPNGLDHMLFVLGIYLLSARPRSVLWQVSAFTVAHSITLGLSLYGVVAVSPKVVEPLIAVSIAYVAIENIFCGVEAVAGSAGIRLRAAAWHGVRGRAAGPRTGTLGVSDGAVEL